MLSLLLVLLLSAFVLYLTDGLNPVLDLNMTDVNRQMTEIRRVDALPDGGVYVIHYLRWPRGGVELAFQKVRGQFPQMIGIWRVAALPDGGAFVINHVRSNDTKQVLRVNVTGQVIQHVYQCVGYFIEGLLVLNNNLYVIYKNGTLIEININNTKTVQVYQVPDVWWMVHWGSLSYHHSVITHPDLLLLADFNKCKIFSYNVTSKNKQVHLTGLSWPTSVSSMTYNSHLYYIVCEWYSRQVSIYNSTWGLFQTLGGTEGSGDGQLDNPLSAIGLPDGSVIISDEYNIRVSLFTIQGKFVRHLLTRSDGLSGPRAMSVSLPYLWLIDFHSRLYRYKLY